MKFFYKILYVGLLMLMIGIANPLSATNDVYGVGTEQKIRFIQCYPNPATTIVNFEFNTISEKGYVLSVFNFIGRKVDEIKINSNRASLNLDNYFRGLYVYQLRDKQGQLIESGKFQVDK
jgi:hypothetical protein